MTTTDTQAAVWLLGTYRVDGHERELHAIRVPGEQTLHIIDAWRARCPKMATSTSATSRIASEASTKPKRSPLTTSPCRTTRVDTDAGCLVVAARHA